MEVYLEGNVIFRQDESKVAGKGDQRTFRATRAYYDFLTDRFVGLDGRGRHVRPGPDRPDEDQVAPDRAVPQADRSGPTARSSSDPNPEIRADQTMIDRQPVPQPGLPDHQPVDRPDPQDAGR